MRRRDKTDSRLRRLWIIVNLSLCVLVLTMASCSESESEEGAAEASGALSLAEAREQVQPVLDHIRELMSQRPPDEDAFWDLVHCTENWHYDLVERQRMFLRGEQAIQNACMERFGRIPDKYERPIWPTRYMDVVDVRTDGTVIVKCQEDGVVQGMVRELHLITVDGEWRMPAEWILATWLGTKKELSDEEKEAGQKVVDRMYRFAERIKNGELTWDELVE